MGTKNSIGISKFTWLLLAAPIAATTACGGGGGKNNVMPPPPITDSGPDVSDAGMNMMTMPDVSETSTALQPCPTPEFSPAAGDVQSGTNIVITAPVGQIHFTTDGTVPTRTSPEYNAGPTGVQITASETFQAIASTDGTTCTDSEVASAVYTVTTSQNDGGEGGVAPETPVFNPAGTATTQANDFQVTLSSTGGSTLCYTLSATAPTCTTTGTTATCDNGSLTYSNPIAVNAAATAASGMPGQVQIQAIACAAGEPTSAVAKALYTLQAAAPTMTPAPGTETWSATLTGTLATTTTGATISYTTNGTAPSCATPVTGQQTYTAPFPLQSGSYQAIACKTGYLASDVGGPFAFTVNLTPPTVTPAAGALAVSPTITVSNAANPTTSWVCYSTSATAPACGAAGVCSAGTLLPANGMFTGLADMGSVQVIACAPAGLGNSTVKSQGPYTLQLAPPVVLPDATTTPAASYTLPAADGTHLAHLKISQASVGTPADQAGGYMCWIKNPGVGIVPACGPTATPCLNGSTQADGAGPTDIETPTTFGAGDSVSVITCPGTTGATGSGFEGSTATTMVFVGQGQAQPPAITATDNSATQPTSDTGNPWFSKVNAVLTNQNSSPMTICYTTSGTAPTCTAGSTATGCATVDGTSSENLTFKVTAAGSGYVNPPAVVLTPNNCTGEPVATLTAGAVTMITATGCQGYSTPPAVTLHAGSGASANGTAFETVTFAVSDGGSGYAHAPTVTLSAPDGVGNNSCTSTVTLTNKSVTAISATGCAFDQNPTVTIDNTGSGGTGAAATAKVTQTVTFTGAQITVGAFYTANPVVTTLVAANGMGGTCTTVTAVETNGGVSSVTATGCSGFSDFGAGDIMAVFASQGPADGSANAAAAIAVPGNSVAVPAIETSGTVLKAVACNAGLGTSPVVPATYDTKLADPTLVVTDTLTGNAAGPNVTAGDTLTIATTSNFTDTKLFFTVDGTNPTCAGHGTAFTGASTTLPVPDISKSPLAVSVIACGANQTASAVQTKTFPIHVASPVVVSAVGTTALGSPGTDSAATVNLTAQNVVTATLSSPTPGSYMCYTLDGSAPVCGGGATAACKGTSRHLVNATTGMVTVDTSESLTVIACEGANASAVTGPVAYTLDITPITVVGAATGMCPSTVAIGFDTSNTTNTNAGGPTTGSLVCYSTEGPPSQCAAGVQAGAGTVTCFTPTTAAPTTPVELTDTGKIYTYACKAQFAGNPVSGQIPVSVTPYTPPTIAVDGVLNTTEWSATLGDQFPTDTAGATGGFTFGATTTAGDTLLFSQGGFTSSATTDVIFYLTDSTTATAGTTFKTGAVGGGTLPFAAQYALEINTHGAAGCAGATCTMTSYTSDGTKWTAQAQALPVNATVTANALEASLATSAVGAIGDTFEVTGVVYNGTALSGGWSKTAGGAQSYVTDTSSSCLSPLATLK